MRIALATDAWHPQVNGVVRTLAATVDEVRKRGFELCLVTPEDCLTVPMPGYASIRLAVAPRFRVRRTLKAFGPDIVHIATEGPIGWSARAWCLATGTPFTTAFHTRFPEYASVRTGLGAERFWPILKRFHSQSRAVLVATESLATELSGRGFRNIARWTRGIDQSVFHPHGALHPAMRGLPRPVLLSVGRVAPEKNLEAFLDARVNGTKVVVGDGPALGRLRSAYPRAVFLGKLTGEDPERAPDEFCRVLKPGGEIIIATRISAQDGPRDRIEKWLMPLTSRLGWRTEFPWSRYEAWAATRPELRLIENSPLPPFGHFSLVRYGK